MEVLKETVRDVQRSRFRPAIGEISRHPPKVKEGSGNRRDLLSVRSSSREGQTDAVEDCLGMQCHGTVHARDDAGLRRRRFTGVVLEET